jgi:hypothetical protein
MDEQTGNTLRARVAELAAAWAVWGEAQHAVRRLVRTAEWSGDLPDGGQRRELKEQFNAQIFEAYARARLQCAIVYAVDGVDQVAEYDRHWQDTWGEVTATRAAAVYVDAFAAALALQQAARAAAREQSAALEAAGVRSDLTPRCDRAPPGWQCSRDRGHEGPCAAHPLATEAAPTVPPPPRRWWWPIGRGA